MSQAQFVRKTYQFLKKPQVVPNALVYDIRLDSDAVRLLLALNGLPDSWTIVQKNVMADLRWGKKRFNSAVNNCVECGYMRVTQSRRDKGFWDSNIFEFDTQPILDDIENPESPPAQAFQPQSPKGCADQRCAVKEPLSCSSRVSSYIEEQTEQDSLEDEAVPVVCSLSSFSEEEQAKRKALEPYPFDPMALSTILTLSLETITDAVQAFEQYRATHKVDNICGCLRKALLFAWKPNITKESKAAEAEKQNERIEQLRQSNFAHAKALHAQWQKRFNDSFSFSVDDRCCSLMIKNKSHVSWSPLSLMEDDFIVILDYYIDSRTQSVTK